jgi:hypothetical protein
LKDDAIDNCECERLRETFVSLREECQQPHGRAYDDYLARIEEAIKNDLKIFFGYVDLKKIVPDDSPFGALQFTSVEVESVFAGF